MKSIILNILTLPSPAGEGLNPLLFMDAVISHLATAVCDLFQRRSIQKENTSTVSLSLILLFRPKTLYRHAG